ncbi:purine-nucleoside phosphorylase [Desulfuribacillus alkaliarsenatis]|uniref:Purine nucleoside phosphorylase n=1 Tax=Desulfuribacillus alkaliarsenatis TaxID=766136 RepID=A0A1E5G5V2_9FIRM|nr:purine-nucleoside phosphorylase [Desulfuribacillus alkaliarsenatis]OEF98475.1 purine-nucleoside phosphorylase [Desulfuribacillus alkaliarsenatis]
MNSFTIKLQEAARYIEERIAKKPDIGLVLGSGLGELAERIDGVRISYSEIPSFPESTVEGHKGQLVIGELEGKQVVAMQGRFHFYEGYCIQNVVFPIRVLKLLGITKLIVTNAAGGVNTGLQPGDLMLITDHINLSGENPLIGPNLEEFGPRFPDMSSAYSKGLRKKALEIANNQGYTMKEGVYAAMSGPSYETPAEVRMLRTLGVDAVGMSTAPEVITAVHTGIEVLGISCISNMAAGILEQPLTHDEVIETTEKVKQKFAGIVLGVIKDI